MDYAAGLQWIHVCARYSGSGLRFSLADRFLSLGSFKRHLFCSGLLRHSLRLRVVPIALGKLSWPVDGSRLKLNYDTSASGASLYASTDRQSPPSPIGCQFILMLEPAGDYRLFFRQTPFLLKSMQSKQAKTEGNLLQEEIALVEGYSSYFSFSRKQSGYSGVATYCHERCMPYRSEEGLSGILASENRTAFVLSENLSLDEFVQSADIYSLDSEGRAIITYHKIRNEGAFKILAVINTYCPRVDPEKPERHVYKMQYCHLLAAKAKTLCRENCSVIIIGDLNIAHNVIDHCDPGDEKEFNSSETRQWLTSFLTSSDNSTDIQFFDAFRQLHPQQQGAYTCWNTLTGARDTNYGTRIDYILISHMLLPILVSCEILPEVHGSDHCPVAASFRLEMTPSTKPPLMCTCLYPEFAGKQQKLMSFFQKPESSSSGNEHRNIKQNFSSEIVPPAKKMKTQFTRTDVKHDKQKSIMNFFSSSVKFEKQNAAGNTGTAKLTVKECKNIVLNNDQMDIDFNFDKANTFEQQELNSKNLSDKQTNIWKSLLSGPPKPPLCKGHNKPCVLRTVKKQGLNFGRQFFACSQPNGHPSNPDSRCNFFQWIKPFKKSVLS